MTTNRNTEVIFESKISVAKTDIKPQDLYKSIITYSTLFLLFFFVHTVLKKVKHRVVENMSSSTADALGLSRAILCNGKFQMTHTYHNVCDSANANLVQF